MAAGALTPAITQLPAPGMLQPRPASRVTAAGAARAATDDRQLSFAHPSVG
jgi:hypothetical protein